MARNFKRVIAMGDMHCGHMVGLTPPEYQEYFAATGDHRLAKLDAIRRELWAFFWKEIKSLGHIDVLIHNGDAIDGKGSKSGGTELLTSDRDIQTDMAAKIVKMIKADNTVMTYGTPYHTGDEEDWESVIAKDVGAKIGSHEWIDVNGTVFDVKHHIGTSSIPHGRSTPLSKDRLWNTQWFVDGEQQPLGNVILRSHAHYYKADDNSDYLAIILPALQGMGSKFGGRICSGKVDFGFLHFDCLEDGSYKWQKHLAKIQSQRAVALKL